MKKISFNSVYGTFKVVPFFDCDDDNSFNTYKYDVYLNEDYIGEMTSSNSYDADDIDNKEQFENEVLNFFENY